MKIKKFFLREFQKNIALKYHDLEPSTSLYTPPGCLIFEYKRNFSSTFKLYVMLETFRAIKEKVTLSVIWKKSLDQELPAIFAQPSEIDGRLRIGFLKGEKCDCWQEFSIDDVISEKDKSDVWVIISMLNAEMEKYIFPFLEDMLEYKLNNKKSNFILKLENS